MDQDMISSANLCGQLKNAVLFSGLDDKTISEFALSGNVRFHDKNTDLFMMGDPAESFFFIIQGWIKLYRLTREGEEAVIHIFGPGETFAEAAVFGPQRKYPVNAQIVEDAAILQIHRDSFVKKIKDDSEFALRILGSISARQHYLVQQIEQMTVKTAPQRIGAFLLRLQYMDPDGKQEVNLPYDKSLVAGRLNIRAETFSRALGKLKPYGVKVRGRHILLEDPEALSEFCDLTD